MRQLAVLDHVQRRRLRRIGLCTGQQTGGLELLQHKIPARQRTLGIAARVVIAGAFHQAHQHRDLLRPQRFQPAPEIELRGGRETVHRLVALLAEENLVDVRLQDPTLAVVQLDQHRHQRFVDLAGEAALAGEEQVAHQLLGQRGRALHRAAGAQVGERRPRDGREIDADVVLEIAVFHRLQAADQQRRHIGQVHDAPLHLAGAVQRGDARGVEMRDGHRLVTGGIGDRAHLALAQRHLDPLRQLAAGRAGIAARGDGVARALFDPTAGQVAAVATAVAGKGQLQLQRGGRHRHARGQRQRPRVHPRGHREHQVVETILHALVEHQHVRQHETDQQAQADPERNAQPRPAAAGKRKGAVEEAQGRRNPAIRFPDDRACIPAGP